VSSKICAAINKFSCNYVSKSNTFSSETSKTQKNTGHLSKSSLITAGVSKTHLLHPKLKII
jgi:hypothetical protein